MPCQSHIGLWKTSREKPAKAGRGGLTRPVPPPPGAEIEHLPNIFRRRANAPSASDQRPRAPQHWRFKPVGLRPVATVVRRLLVVDGVWSAEVDWNDVIDDEAVKVWIAQRVVDGFAAQRAGELLCADARTVSVADAGVACGHVTLARRSAGTTSRRAKSWAARRCRRSLRHC